MARKITILAFILTVLVLAELPGRITAQENFQLEGKIVQGTADGEALSAALPLRLQILDENGDSIDSFSTGTNSDGSFSFPDVPIQDDHFYVVTTFWAGIEQSSLPMTYNEIQELDNAILEFPLYELTDSLANVVANRGNLRIEFT
ncbi:MAG TPA: hypothetical protein VJZ27_19420, partial [Aggregatilineales bacterium]|nr:hypothetical protein [Aggregatilineales bacterium]